MWARSLVVVAVMAGPAAAEFDASPPRDLEPVIQTPRLRIGHPGDRLTIDKVAVTIQQDALGLSARVTMSVSTADTIAREAAIVLEVPAGARVTGVAITIGKTERMVALSSSAQRALAEYEGVLERGNDPVLVQWKSAGTTGDVLEVRTFPLTKTAPGRIELTIELPAMASLMIDTLAPSVEIASVTRRTYRKVKAPIRVAVPERHELELPAPLVVARPHVSPTTSFYAGFAPSVAVPRVVFGHVAVGRWHSGPAPFSKGEIRREIRRHIARLGHCYTRVVQYKGGPSGEAVLHFTIDPAGKIAETETRIDGTLTEPEITSCLAKIVAQFEFRPSDSRLVVSYPLQFHLVES